MNEQLNGGQTGSETEVHFVLPTRYLEVCISYLSIKADIEVLRERIKDHGVLRTRIRSLGNGSSIVTVVFANSKLAAVCRDLVRDFGEQLGISLFDSPPSP